MDNATQTEFSEIATRAIFESLSPSRRQIGEYTQKAIFHAGDPDFRAVMDGIARGMGLKVNRVSRQVGVVLSVQDQNSPFSPRLSWLSSRLPNAPQHHRDELHCFALLTLTALLCEAFPSEYSTGPEWSSPAQFNVEDVQKRLHELADEIVNRAGTTAEHDAKTQPLAAAQIVVENRLPRQPTNDGGRTTTYRSQQEMILSWIGLLEDYGLLVMEQGYLVEDQRWIATEKLKVHIGQVALAPLVELLGTMAEKIDASPDSETDTDEQPSAVELF